MKALEWLKSTNIEIQEQEDGKWIEIHLNETESDNIDDLNEKDEENLTTNASNSTTQSENEQLLIYADIISNFIIKEIIKADEKRKHHSC